MGGLLSRVYYERALGAWAVPLPTIDPQIVLRSARLCEAYGPAFRYGHYAQVKKLSTVVGAGIALGSIGALAQLRPTSAMGQPLIERVQRAGISFRRPS